MSYSFEGQTFSTLADFQRAFPVYRTYTDLIKKGVSTVIEMEKEIKQRQDNWKAASLRQVRANNTFSFSKKRRKT